MACDNAVSHGYSESAGQVQCSLDNQGVPFTGLDLGPLVAVGMMLMVLGVCLRRVARVEA